MQRFRFSYAIAAAIVFAIAAGIVLVVTGPHSFWNATDGPRLALPLSDQEKLQVLQALATTSSLTPAQKAHVMTSLRTTENTQARPKTEEAKINVMRSLGTTQ